MPVGCVKTEDTQSFPTNARCIHHCQAFPGNVGHPFKRKSRHRTQNHLNFQTIRHHWLAPKRAPSRKARFCLPERESGPLCGWMLLAWVSLARAETREQPRVLASETRSKPSSRPCRHSQPTGKRLARIADMGACFTAPRSRRGPVPQSIISLGKCLST